MLDIRTTTTPEEAVAAAVSQYIRDRSGAPTLLMIAGGSLPEGVLPYVDRDILSPQVTISIFDERCTEHEVGLNELQLAATVFYCDALAVGVQQLDVVVGDHATCPLVATDWEDRLRAWQQQHPMGEIVVLAGVGSDGHIAGILCHTPEETPVFTGTDWIVAHRFAATDNQYPYRITPTFTFWQEAVTATFIYMQGADKVVALAALQDPAADLATTPAAILQRLPGSVTLFSDM